MGGRFAGGSDAAITVQKESLESESNRWPQDDLFPLQSCALPAELPRVGDALPGFPTRYRLALHVHLTASPGPHQPYNSTTIPNHPLSH
jgi:hypothetical protein